MANNLAILPEMKPDRRVEIDLTDLRATMNQPPLFSPNGHVNTSLISMFTELLPENDRQPMFSVLSQAVSDLHGAGSDQQSIWDRFLREMRSAVILSATEREREYDLVIEP